VNKNKQGLALLIAGLLAGQAWGADSAASVPDCAGITDVKSKSRPLLEQKALMPVLLMLEGKGEAHFHPEYAPPASQCVFEKFEVAGAAVQAIYSPLEKDPQPTLHWRFQLSGAEARELLVFYDGAAAFMAKKDVFYVVEERKGVISYYAMFRDQPTYAALKPIAVSIFDGSAQPLAAVRWPPGEKEPVIDAFDSKRLK
jgi:hypothetical protein